jgi:hypothetical protein
LTIIILNTVNLILSFRSDGRSANLGLHPPRGVNRASSWPHRLGLGYLCRSSAFDCHQRNGHSIVLYRKFALDTEINEGHKWVLDLLQRDAEKICILLPCLAKIAVCSPRNQYPPLTESFGTIEIQGSPHRLNLRVGSGNLCRCLDALNRRVGKKRAAVFDDCFERNGGDIVSLERVREGVKAEDVKI